MTARMAILAVLGLMLAAAPPSKAASAAREQPAREADSRPAGATSASGHRSRDQRRLWRLAQGHLRDGAPRMALPYLERLVTARPGDARVRLELAYALFLIEEDDRARYHFEQALGGDIGARERAVAGRILDEIARRKSWGVHLRFAVIPETNPFQRPSAETILIGGYRFRLDPEARASSGTGVRVGGGVAWTPRLGRDMKARVSLSALSETYAESSFNDVVLRAEAGLLRAQGRGGRIGGGLLFTYRQIGGDTYQRGPGAYLDYGARVGPRTSLDIRAEYTDLTYPGLPHRDGPMATARLRLNHAVTARLAVQGSIFAGREEAAAGFASVTEYGLTLGAHYAFAGGIIGSVEISGETSERDAPSPLFGKVREDELWRVGLRIRDRDITIAGFAPTLGLFHERRRSSIAFYDYETTSATFGLSRDF